MRSSLATVRWVTSDLAAALGYTDPAALGGHWVVERAGDEWVADLDAIAEVDALGAQAAAEVTLGRSGTWRRLPANYGVAYELHPTCVHCDVGVRAEGLQLVSNVDDLAACSQAPMVQCGRCDGEGCARCEGYGEAYGRHAVVAL